MQDLRTLTTTPGADPGAGLTNGRIETLFTLKIATDNAAFGDNELDARATLRYLLVTQVSDGLETNANGGTIRDENGNTVGEWSNSDREPAAQWGQLIARHTEERCGTCHSGSRGTCTQATEHDRAADKVVHYWDPVQVASGEIIS